MNRFEFYKSLYETEEKKRAEFDDSLNIPLTIIVILGAAIFTIYTNFKYSEFNFNTWLFIISCCVSLLLLLISISYLINVFAFSFRSDYKYRYIEFADELEQHFMSLQNYYSYSADAQRNSAISEFENLLIRRYVICCGANTRINKKKSKYLNLGKEFLVATLISEIISIVTFTINYFYHL